MGLWAMSRAELGGLFGVSRQAVSKWIESAVPADRVQRVADVEAITDLLCRYLKRDRIAAVVRRQAPDDAGHEVAWFPATSRSHAHLIARRPDNERFWG